MRGLWAAAFIVKSATYNYICQLFLSKVGREKHVGGWHSLLETGFSTVAQGCTFDRPKKLFNPLRPRSHVRPKNQTLEAEARAGAVSEVLRVIHACGHAWETPA